MANKAFSNSIKAKAVADFQDGIKANKVAKIYKTTPSTIRQWVRKAGNGNNIKPEPISRTMNQLVNENLELKQEVETLIRIIQR